MDGRELARTPAVRDFALAVGEWLLARRFGAITPLAFSYYVWESHGWPSEDTPPHVVISLLVNDPPPPPPEWLALSAEERAARPIREWADARLWPFEDTQALHEAADARARELGVPDVIDRLMPVRLVLFASSEAKDMRFPHVRERRAASARA